MDVFHIKQELQRKEIHMWRKSLLYNLDGENTGLCPGLGAYKAQILLTKGNCWPDEGPRVEIDGAKQAGKEMVSKCEDRSESQDLAELPNPQLTE